jgi:hypothetical protein
VPRAFLLQSLRVFSGLIMPGLCLLSSLLITCRSCSSVLPGFKFLAWSRRSRLPLLMRHSVPGFLRTTQ